MTQHRQPTIPRLGLGVWQVPDGPECENAVRWALELGYRHIDTAQAYGNEESVGRALRDSGVPREEMFITTKFFPRHKDPAAEPSGAWRLGVDHVDLYIIHWPQGGPTWAWPGMEQARERGHARSIGVSNFSAQSRRGARVASTPPVVNQVQFSPFEYRRALLEACRGAGSCSRPTARSVPAATSGARRVEIAAADRTDPRAGAAALVPAARHDRAPEVDPPRADRGERAESSTSRSPSRTWRSSTRSTGPAARPSARAKWW